jgi:CheY-like chemotaxis protein
MLCEGVLVGESLRDGQSGSATVLLVEDDPMVRLATSMSLEGFGYKVIQTDSPGEAIRICKNCDLQIDLIMTDVVMPEMTGYEMVVKIRAFLPGIKVLFTSGYSPELLANELVAGQFHFIQKPFTIAVLEAKVKEVLVS